MNPVAASFALVPNTPSPTNEGEHCEGCDDLALKERAGSMRCGGFIQPPDPTDIVERWHNETHPNSFRFCDQQPCHAINWAAR
jgi:hypothetical protein